MQNIGIRMVSLAYVSKTAVYVARCDEQLICNRLGSGVGAQSDTKYD